MNTLLNLINQINIFWHVILPMVFLALVFLIIREIVCWYWKLNEIVNILHKIIDRLDEAESTRAIIASRKWPVKVKSKENTPKPNIPEPHMKD